MHWSGSAASWVWGTPLGVVVAPAAFTAPLKPSDVRRARALTTADLKALGVVRLAYRVRASVCRNDVTAEVN
jgi:hypothetical protein